MQSLAGLYFHPTQSLMTTPGSSTQYQGVYQRGFTYDHSISSQASNRNLCNYLTINLNEFVEVAGNNPSNLYPAFNYIHVSAYLSNKTDIGHSNVVKFEHKFLTDYHYNPNILEPIFGYDFGSQSYLYSFETQTVSSAATSPWSPSGVMNTWENGSNCVDGTYWNPDENTVIGWNCGNPTYNLTNSIYTGARGGVDVNNNPPLVPNPNLKYIYTEASFPNTSGKCWITRTPAFNLTNIMTDTTNDVNLVFYTHGYTSNPSVQSNLKVYISDQSATTTSNSNTNLLYTIGSSQYTVDENFTQTSTTSPYQKITISLNNYRNLNQNLYLYFVAEGNTSYQSDICIDQVFIEEAVGGFNYVSDFIEFSSAPDATDSDSFNFSLFSQVNVINSPGETNFQNPIVQFFLSFTDNQDSTDPSLPYIKGTYLLM